MYLEAPKTIARAVIPRSVRNSFRSPSRLAQWLWDSSRFLFGNTVNVQILPDWSVRCHPEAHRVILEAQVLDRLQRQEFLDFVSYCSTDMFLFDIGAHFGIFSMAAARFGGRAVAVDPSASAVRMISREADLNGFSSQIRAIQAAVSDCSGMLPMLSSGLFSHGYLRFTASRPRRELTQVEAFTIDDMVQRFGVPTHIKVDVEGHELAVLRGARSTLRQFAPVLFLEMHNAMIRAEGSDPASVLDELQGVNYATFDSDGKQIGRNDILEQSIIRIVAKAC